MTKRSLSIRWHLAIFGALGILPFLLVGFLIASQYVTAERARAQRIAQNLVQTVTAAIDGELERYRFALWVLSTSQTLKDGNIAAFYERAKTVADELPGVVIALREQNGQPLFLTALPLSSRLQSNADGILLEADRDAIASNKTVISNLFRGGTTAGLFVSIDQPIVSDGRTTALLNIAIPPERLQAVLLEQVKTGWLFGVTDNKGRLVARTWDFERYVGQKATSTFLERTEAAAGEFTNITLDGVSVYNVWQRSPLTGWRMSVGIPTAELEAPIRRSIFVLATLTLVGILASLLLARFYGERLVRRIKALELYAASVQRPGTNVSPEITGIAEVDSVFNSLTKAASTLREHVRIQNSLIDELNHRVKNTLAIIHSISWQTRKRSSSLDGFGTAFEGRLMALARSHDALTQSGWRGSNLREIVRAACRPFAEEDRIHVYGEPVELSSRAVVSLGMVLHELATNAAKYGALSNAAGYVDVRWYLESTGESQMLHFEWKERDGPSLHIVGKKGFGSVLIKSLIEQDLHGQGTILTESDGLRFTASFPVRSTKQTPDEVPFTNPLV